MDKLEYIWKLADSIKCPNVSQPCPVSLDGEECLCTVCSSVHMIKLTIDGMGHLDYEKS